MDRLLMGFAGALIAFAAGLPALGDRDFWPPDEARYGEIVQARLSGATSVWAPHSNGELYPDKPPGYFLLMEGLARAMGSFDEGVSRLPSVLGGAMAAAAVGYIATGAFGALGALGGILLMTGTAAFIWQLRYTQMDMLVAGLVALMLTAAYRSFEGGSAWWSYAAWLLFGIGLFVKGPLAAVGLLVWVAWCALLGRNAAFWNRGTALGSLTVALCGLVWFHLASESLQRLGPEVPGHYFGTMFGTHVLERVTGGVAHDKPWYAYGVMLPAMLFPATPILLSFCKRSWIRNLSPRAVHVLKFAGLWIVLPLVLMSLSAGKRSIYLLPLFPGFGIAFAAIVAQLKDQSFWGMRAWAGAVGVLAMSAGTAVLALTFWPSASVDVLTECFSVMRRIDEQLVQKVLAAARTSCLAFGMSMLLGGLLVTAFSYRGSLQRSVLLAGGVGLLGMVLFCSLLAPLANPFISRRPLAEQARLVWQERGSEGPIYYFSHRDEAIPFYLGRAVQEIGSTDSNRRAGLGASAASESVQEPKVELLRMLHEPGSMAFAALRDLIRHNVELERDVHELARGQAGSKTIVLVEGVKP